MGRFTTRWLSIVFGAAAAFLASCVVPIKYDAAVPRGLSQQYAHEVRESIISVDLPALVLNAQVQAVDWNGQRLSSPLAVWVSFVSHSDAVTLDARHVRLQVDDDEVHKPLSYFGPSTAWFSPRALVAGCGPRTYEAGMGLTRSGVSRTAILTADIQQGVYRPTDFPIPLTGEGCFLFWFDAHADPRHSFTLSIDGLVHGNLPVEVPELHFEQGTVTTVGGFP